jgi:hypothetical protein
VWAVHSLSDSSRLLEVRCQHDRYGLPSPRGRRHGRVTPVRVPTGVRSTPLAGEGSEAQRAECVHTDSVSVWLGRLRRGADA